MSFNAYLGKYADHNFIDNMIEESKYCSEGMKKNLKKTMKILRTLLFNASVTMNEYANNNINGVSAHRDRNINLRLNHKRLVVFRSLKAYYLHLNLQKVEQIQS